MPIFLTGGQQIINSILTRIKSENGSDTCKASERSEKWINDIQQPSNGQSYVDEKEDTNLQDMGKRVSSASEQVINKQYNHFTFGWSPIHPKKRRPTISVIPLIESKNGI